MNPESAIPILVGSGQVQQKLDDPREAREPIELMESALREAAEDAGAPGLLRAADAIWVLQGIWDYSNPAALLAERVGAHRVQTGLAPISGSSVQNLVCRAAKEIEAGRREIVLIVGGEAEHSKRRARKRQIEVRRTPQTGSTPDLDFGGSSQFMTREEIAKGLARPTSVYSMFENAIRHERGESPAAHGARISSLWERFAAVAESNPNAWDRSAPSAKEIGSIGATNRMVAAPYTKKMVSNIVVDQAAAIIICSEAAGRRMGISPDKFVYPHVAVEVAHAPTLSAMENYHSCTHLGLAGRRALELAGLEAEAIPHIDLYSCFPSAVQIGARELGLSLDRPLTLTGGLGFAGGPFNSYVLHSLATGMNKSRAEPADSVLVSSVGGWFSKVAVAIYSSTPPEAGYRYACVDDEVANLPTRESTREVDCRGTIESYALTYLDGAPGHAVASCLLDDGRRVFANNEDRESLDQIAKSEACGRSVSLTSDDRFAFN